MKYFREVNPVRKSRLSNCSFNLIHHTRNCKLMMLWHLDAFHKEINLFRISCCSWFRQGDIQCTIAVPYVKKSQTSHRTTVGMEIAQASSKVLSLQSGCCAVAHKDSTKSMGKSWFSADKNLTVQTQNVNGVALSLLWDYVYISSPPVTMQPLISVGMFLTP